MSVVNFPIERRRKRSEQAHTAITYQLEYVFEQQDLQHFALGDSSGLLLAGVGDSDAATALAAYAPVLATRRGPGRQKMLAKVQSLVPDLDEDKLSIRGFRVDGQTLYLCSVGGEEAARQASLYRAITGIRRILKQTAAA